MSAIQSSIHKVLAASATKGDDGTNLFTISTDELDRDHDRIDQRGWDLTAYKQNPIVLYGHDHKGLPIGKCTDIRVVGGKLKGTIEWPPTGCYPFADQVRNLVDAGFLRSASVGFIADRTQPNEYGGHDITKARLIEWSLVSLPSNPSALLERGVDRMRLKSWLGNSWREQPKEGPMKSTDWIEIDDGDEPYLELKDSPDPFDEMLQRLRQVYAEMTSGKFMELMELQINRLGPAASISDLMHAISESGVAQPRSVRAETVNEKILRFNRNNRHAYPFC